jgi:L-fuconolactonase
VVVQSDQSEDENTFQLENAEKFDFIRGIVGWVDLQNENVQERLQHFSSFKKLKGFRHVLQGEPQRDMMLNEKFKKGIGFLSRYHFTYDILIFPDQLKFSEQLVAAFPDQKFVIDHLAKPHIKSKEIDVWKQDIGSIAKHENVYCKISGFVTEADWNSWSGADFVPYFETVVEAFGTDRIVFGSDWPVCLVAAEYNEVVDIVKDYFSSFTLGEQQKFFGGNAIQFYNL